MPVPGRFTIICAIVSIALASDATVTHAQLLRGIVRDSAGRPSGERVGNAWFTRRGPKRGPP